MFEGRLGPRKRAHKAAELLTQVGMAHRAGHLPQSMSVGERQRVAIARSLANDPVLLLADEPTGSLDTKTGPSRIMTLFDDLHSRSGMTVLMVTHDPHVTKRRAAGSHTRWPHRVGRAPGNDFGEQLSHVR